MLFPKSSNVFHIRKWKTGEHEASAFYCDEPYNPPHRCQKLFWLEVVDEPVDAEPNMEDPDQPAIVLHAITGSNGVQAMHVMGKISTQPV